MEEHLRRHRQADAHVQADAALPAAAQTDPLGHAYATSYEPVGRPWSTRTPLNALATLAYDPDGRVIARTDPLGYVTTTQYDAAGHPTTMINALGQQSLAQYDGAGRTLATADPLGYRRTISYDAAGREIGRIDPNGHATTLIYDFAGRVQAQQDARGYLTTTLYDNADQPVALLNARGYRSTTAYDARGLVSGTQDALGAWSYVQYDPAGNPVLRTDARGWATTYGYDALNRVQGVLYRDGTAETHTYDSVGRQITMQDVTGITAYSYDAAGRQTAVAYRSARGLTYVYDSSGNRTQLISPDGTAVTYSYDAAERLTGIVNPYGEYTTTAYDALHREKTKTLASGLSIGHAYDAAGRQTLLTNLSSTGAALAAYTATYDAAGNRTSVWELDGSRVTYLYDAGDQLLDEWRSGPSAYHASYTYDPAGNRLAKGVNGSLTTYAYNGVNQMTVICPAGSAANVQSYDASGNLLGQNAGGALSTYTWDGENRLLVAATPQALETYTYNALGHRITRQSTRGLGAENQAFYTTDPGQYGGLSSHRQYGLGTSRFYGADMQGHSRQVTDAAGLRVATYVYSAFGEPILSSADATSLRFGGDVGYYRDEDSRLYVRARHLDPANGRWLSRDPIGIAGGLNLYGYTGNNPVTGIDPSGKQTREGIAERIDVKEIPVSTAFAGMPGMNTALMRALRADYKFYQVNLTEFDPITHRTISSVAQFLFAKPIRVNLAGNYWLARHDRRAGAWINTTGTNAYFRGPRNGIGSETRGDYKDMFYPPNLYPLFPLHTALTPGIGFSPRTAFTPRAARIGNQLHKLLDHAGNFNGGMVAQGYGTLFAENEIIGGWAKSASDTKQEHHLVIERDDRYGQMIFQTGWLYGEQKELKGFVDKTIDDIPISKPPRNRDGQLLLP